MNTDTLDTILEIVKFKIIGKKIFAIKALRTMDHAKHENMIDGDDLKITLYNAKCYIDRYEPAALFAQLMLDYLPNRQQRMARLNLEIKLLEDELEMEHNNPQRY